MKYDYELSICMMVKDESKNLTRCLDSLLPALEKPYVELIIVDTGSSDNTVEIAGRYTDKVFFHPWNNHFSEMRNITISYARGEWIFILDADEEVKNPGELIALFERDNIKKYNTITVQMTNIFHEKQPEGQFVFNVSKRIFRNDGEFRYRGAVHNQPVFKGPVLNSEVFLMHYGYIIDDKELVKKKFDRTATILKRELEENPNDIYYRYQLAASYFNIDKKKAMSEIRKAYGLLKKIPEKEQRLYTYIYGIYARIAYKNESYQETIEVCSEGIERNREYVDLYYMIAECWFNIRDKKAIGYFEKYLSLSERYNKLAISKDAAYTMYHVDDQSRSVAQYNLGYLYFKSGEYEEAIKNVLKVEGNLLDSAAKKELLIIEIFLEKGDYDGLHRYYTTLDNRDGAKGFTEILEKKKSLLGRDIRKEIENAFSKGEDAYAFLNKIRAADNEQKTMLAKEFLTKEDLNKLPAFYGEVIKTVIEDRLFLNHVFKKIKGKKLKGFIHYLIARDRELVGYFEKYLLSADIRPNDFQSSRAYASIANALLFHEAEESKNSKRKPQSIYQDIFCMYIDRGTNYLTSLYQYERFRLIYRTMESEEEQFLVLMHLTADEVKRGNIKRGIEYFREGIQTYPYLTALTEKFREELRLIND